MRQLCIGIVLVALAMGLPGCGLIMKPFDVPEYQEIGPNETGFLISLEGNTSKQAKFSSVEKLQALQVAVKRVQITHRWKKTGRTTGSGEWISNVRLIKVNRSPETRVWTASTEKGTSNQDEGIWAESKDSVGFSTGFSVTAMITEQDAALFLYRYHGKSLAYVLDTEAKARMQSVVSEVAATYDMSDLRAKKTELVAAARADLRPFFTERGVTITTIAQFGGFTYENPQVQTSIDEVFIAQREKEVAAAKLEAQTDKNARIEKEADAMANKERKIASGIADGKRAILAVAKEAAENPVFLEMRRLEVEEARIGKWDGSYPQYMMSVGANGGGPALLLEMPGPKQ